MRSLVFGPSLIKVAIGDLTPPQPVDYRDFTDAAKTRQYVYDSVLGEVNKMEPIGNDRYTLQLHNAQYQDPDVYSKREQKRALLTGETIGRRIKGTWELTDPSGTLLDSRTQVVARVPFMSDRGTFIHNGNEYTVRNQQRLKPGIFTRTKENGEIESHVNVLAGNGVGHHYHLDPAKQQFTIRMRQANIPLMPLLKAMGVNDRQLKEAWGPEIFAANYITNDESAIRKIAEKVLSPKDLKDKEIGSLSKRVAERFQNMQIDPFVSRKTLGQDFNRLDSSAILAATRKLIAVNKGEAETDDRDQSAFQTFHGPEELFSERIRRDHGRIRRNVLSKISKLGDLSKMPSGVLTEQLEQLLIGSGLAQNLEEINMSELIDKQTSLTRMGEGGISSTNSIPDEARSVHPSQMGLIDPIRTPECHSKDTEVLTSKGWKFWPEVTENDKLACLLDDYDTVDFCKPINLIDDHYSGFMLQFYGQKINYSVTANHRMLVNQRNSAVDWEFLEALILHGAITFYVKTGFGDVYIKEKTTPEMYSRIFYDDKVYCAEVPGGLLYTRRNNSCGFWNGNSLRAGVDLYLSRNAYKGKDGKLYAKFNDVKTGKQVWKTPEELADLTIAFPDSFKWPTKRIPVMQGGKHNYVPRDQVDLQLGSGEDDFSPLSNLIPGKSALKAHRVAMGSRMLTQALPLRGGEAPLLQGALPGSNGERSFEEELGSKMGAVFADQDGEVVGVDPENATMRVRYADGKQDEIEMYQNFPFNRKTALHQEPLVKPGDVFRKGQPIIRSNYTDDKGATALGMNLRVAYMPWLGKSFEDANVISESAAKRLTSEHIYQHNLELDDKTRFGKNSFVSLFPQKFERKKLDMLDDQGLIKPGTEVQYGDPLILSARENVQTQNKIHKRRQAGFTDQTVTWDHHDPGIVTDVVMGKNGPAVVVKSASQTQVGDKLCYDEQTEVLTEMGWKPICELTTDDRVATLSESERIEYLHPITCNRFQHRGRMYSISTSQVNLLVTDNHKLYAQLRDRNYYELIEAKHLFGKRYRMKRNGTWKGTSPQFVELEGVEVKAGQFGNGVRMLNSVRIKTNEYCAILGMFLSEGNLLNHKKSGSYGFELTQIKEKTRAQMHAKLNQLGIRFYDAGDKVRIYSKVWFNHLKQFGKQKKRFIPNEVFTWNRKDLRTLYDWLFWGDGHVGKTHSVYTTTSKQLADDVQRLAFHLGWSANIRITPARRGKIKGHECTFSTRYDVYVYKHKNRPTTNHGHVNKQKAQMEKWVDYDGFVYCPTMPKNHVIYVRRSGKPVWCGNSGRFGDKGVIGAIIPDDQMPKDGKGQPYEMLVNTMGLQSRTNPIQMIEAWLSKIAAKTGKPYKLEDFDKIDDLTEYTRQELAKNGLSDYEDVYLPDGGKLAQVGTGLRFFMKLHHTAESKLQGRGSAAYSSEETPAKGGETGCFAYYTEIETKKGNEQIGDIVEDKKVIEVLSYDPKTKKKVYKKVTHHFMYDAKLDDILVIELANGKKMMVTKNHKMYLKDGTMKLAGDLIEEDELLGVDE